jgi:hypothetical protein
LVDRSADKVGQDGFLHVETVFGLVENGLRVRFKRFAVDLLAPVRREAMHNKSVGMSEFD